MSNNSFLEEINSLSNLNLLTSNVSYYINDELNTSDEEYDSLYCYEEFNSKKVNNNNNTYFKYTEQYIKNFSNEQINILYSEMKKEEKRQKRKLYKKDLTINKILIKNQKTGGKIIKKKRITRKKPY